MLAANARRARAAGDESQVAFAKRAGVPLRSYERFELDSEAALRTVVQLLRAHERTQYLPLIFPAQLSPPRPAVKTKLMRVRAMRLLELARQSDAPVTSFNADD